MSFANPGYLFLLLLLIPIIGWYIYELHKADASLQISNTATLKRQPKSLRIYMMHIPFVLRTAVVILLTLALARPQLTNRYSNKDMEGIDIMMALDISGTMLAEDLKPNRLEAAKDVAKEFIANRENDQIGLVLFAGQSFTQCPLTTDHTALTNLFSMVQFGMIEDGTAIGLGLANAVNRIKDSPTKSKVIILLTDGSNNRGDIAPKTAAEIAKTYNIRVYTIGVGSHQNITIPVQTPTGIQRINLDPEFDETTLKEIATMTGGAYFRATDNASLEEIYQQIDKMEKTKIQVKQYAKHTDYFIPYLIAALVCLLLEVILRYFVLRTISN